jgi:chorismate mutase
VNQGAVHDEAIPDQAAEPGDASDADRSAALIGQLREEIDKVDAELIGIVQRRITLSQQIQGVRMANGGRRREHSRELKIVNTYVEGLGHGGGQIALSLLELCRGRA